MDFYAILTNNNYLCGKMIIAVYENVRASLQVSVVVLV